MRILGSFSRTAQVYVPNHVTDSHVIIPDDIYDAIVSQSGVKTSKIKAVIFNEAFVEDGEIPILVDLIKSETPYNGPIRMNRYLYSFLLGTVQLDTDRFKVVVISGDKDKNIASTKTIERSLKNIERISNKPQVKNPNNPFGYATYYDPWVLKNVDILSKQFKKENEQELNNRIFFSSLKNFNLTNLLNPAKTSFLYEVNFIAGFKVEVIESEIKTIIVAKNILTCAETGSLFLKQGEKIFVKEAIDYTDYKEALIEMNRAAKSPFVY